MENQLDAICAKTVEESIVESLKDDVLRKIFSGTKAELTKEELALIDSRHSNDLCVLELIKGMSLVEFAFCDAYRPMHIEHYGAIERVDWLKSEIFFLGEILKRKPSPKEIIEYSKRLKLGSRFHVYYAMTYGDLVIREGNVGIMSGMSLKDLKEAGRRVPLSSEEKTIVDSRFGKDKMILARIKSMTREELFECDKYRPLDFEHYMQVQRFDWTRTEAYLLGMTLQHEPSEEEICTDAMKFKNWPRYRAWYNFMYPGLVERAE